MSRVDGLAYGGDSLADKYAGTGIYRRQPTYAELVKARQDKEAAERAAKAAFVRRLMDGAHNGQIVQWVTRSMTREVTVLRVKAGAIRIFYDGCTVDVSPFDLVELA